MMPELTFTMPWPPSVNAYFSVMTKGPLAGRLLLSSKARTYRTAARDSIVDQGIAQGSIAGSIEVEIIAHPPNRRARDLDNILKPILDSLKHACVILDDVHIDDLRIRRGAIMRDGCLEVYLRQLAAVVARPSAADQAKLELTG